MIFVLYNENLCSDDSSPYYNIILVECGSSHGSKYRPCKACGKQECGDSGNCYWRLKINECVSRGRRSFFQEYNV